jgi:ketosteroid isomerase-like protein
MAARKADLLTPIYEEWGRGNWRPAFDVYDARMEWGWSSEFLGLGGVIEDRRDPNPRLHAWLSGWEHWRAEAEDYLEMGDYVVVLAAYHGRGKGSGVEISQEGAHVFKLRDDKVVRLEIFASRERAIESVEAALAEEQALTDGVTPRG